MEPDSTCFGKVQTPLTLSTTSSPRCDKRCAFMHTVCRNRVWGLQRYTCFFRPVPSSRSNCSCRRYYLCVGVVNCLRLTRTLLSSVCFYGVAFQSVQRLFNETDMTSRSAFKFVLPSGQNISAADLQHNTPTEAATSAYGRTACLPAFSSILALRHRKRWTDFGTLPKVR